jgi:hypothetical protein
MLDADFGVGDAMRARLRQEGGVLRVRVDLELMLDGWPLRRQIGLLSNIETGLRTLEGASGEAFEKQSSNSSKACTP